MGSIADIEAETQSERAAILAHPFVTGMGVGSLPVEKFKHYVTQDYVYLSTTAGRWPWRRQRLQCWMICPGSRACWTRL